jgi:Helix-turn-helix domain
MLVTDMHLNVSDSHFIRDKRRRQVHNGDRFAPTGTVPVENDAPKTLSVPKAGKQYFDLGRNASYEAARRGELPVIKIGRRLRVPIAALERMLAEVNTGNAT